MLKKTLKIAGLTGLYLFALVGLFFIGGFVAMKLHLTDTLGQIDSASRYFNQTAVAIRTQLTNSEQTDQLMENLCRAQALKKLYPDNGNKILSAYEMSRSSAVLAKMLVATERLILTDDIYRNETERCRQAVSAGAQFSAKTTDLYAWVETPEWQTLKAGLVKDKDVLAQVGQETGIEPRLIAAQVVGEQLRLYHSNREIFKQFFQPLKILGNEVQFSLGVAGIKKETARQIEKNLADASSVYYLGPAFEHLLDFKTNNQEQERFSRLTDEKNHYYSYLYTALFLKQVMSQWEKAGFPITDRPEVLATIFNIGFARSIPKADPQVGGAEITITTGTYTFGSLAYEFYYSGELLSDFPYRSALFENSDGLPRR